MTEANRRGIGAQGLRHRLWVTYLLMFVLPTAYMLFVLYELSSGGLSDVGAAILTVALVVGLPVALVMSIAALMLLNHSFQNMQGLVTTIESFLQEFRTMQIAPPPSGDEAQQVSHYVVGMMGEFKRHMSAIDRYAEELHAANEQLENLALVDAQTGLYNRKHAMRTLDIEVQRVVRSGGHLSMLRIAVNELQAAETEHGREVRDALIAQVAAAIAGNVRRVDLVAHFGDGQFLVLLLETSEDGARIAAERMQTRVGAQRVRAAGGGRTITPSIGVGVATHKGEAEGALEFLARAESRLVVAQGTRAG